MKKLFILIVLLLLVGACKEEEKEILFKGSGKYWSAELVVSVINGSEKKQIEIRYGGNNLNRLNPLIILLKVIRVKFHMGQKVLI